MPQKGKGKKKGGKGAKNSPKKANGASPAKGSPNKQQNGVEEQKSDDPVIQLKNEGNREFGKSNFEKAIELYSKALELDPKNHTIYSNRSAAYLNRNELELALNDANECIKLEKTWAKGYIRKGNVLASQKKFDEASDIYKNGLELCIEKQGLHKALDDLDFERINTLDKKEKIVGGHHPQADKFRTLINWLIDGGARFPKLYLKFYSPEYRAIHAMDRINKDEDICYIPHDYIMTSDVARDSEIGQKIIASKIELRSKHSYLASYLLQERDKGKESKWFVYIDILPKKFETIPLFFNDDQRNELEGSMAIKKIDDRIESLRMEYDALCENIPEYTQWSHDDFVWARLVVITRIFGLVINDVKTDGLVAMADMLNHKRPRETKWTYDEKKKGFVITSLQSIDKDSEIFDSYGRKCNSRFFVNYGFSLENNLDNEAIMSFELPQNDPQFAIKARHLRFTNTDKVQKEFQIPKQYKEKKVKECFSFLRIMAAQGNEFLIISSADGLRNDDIPALSIRNETTVLTTLAVAATRALKAFPTTLEEDNALLEDKEKYPMFCNARNIVLMRRGEKDVLTHYIELMNTCKPLFSKKLKDLKAEIRKNKRLKDPEDPIGMYIKAVVEPLVQRSRN